MVIFSVGHFVGNKAKGRISERVFQENKARQIFRKANISYLLMRTRPYAYQEVRKDVCVSGGKKYSFFGKFDVLCFLLTPVLRFFFLSYYRRLFGKEIVAYRKKSDKFLASFR